MNHWLLKSRRHNQIYFDASFSDGSMFSIVVRGTPRPVGSTYICFETNDIAFNIWHKSYASNRVWVPALQVSRSQLQLPVIQAVLVIVYDRWGKHLESIGFKNPSNFSVNQSWHNTDWQLSFQSPDVATLNSKYI